MAFRTGFGKIWSKITGIAVRNVILATPGEPKNLVRKSLFGFGPIAADGHGYPGGAVASSGSGRRPTAGGGAAKRPELTPDEKTTANLNDVANTFRRALDSFEKNKNSRNVGWMALVVGVIFLAGLGFSGHLFDWVGKYCGLNGLALLFTLAGFVKASSSRPNLAPVAGTSDRFLTSILLMAEKPKDSNGNPLNVATILDIVLGNRDNKGNLLALLANAPNNQKALARQVEKYIQEASVGPAGTDRSTLATGLVANIKEVIKGIRRAEAEQVAREKALIELEAQKKEQAEADKKAAQSKRAAAMRDTGGKKKE